jgi:hypothetical protein
MLGKPCEQHAWLEKMVGEWTFEGEGFMGPDKPPHTFSGTESVRSLSGMWVVAEAHMPDGTPATNLMTLGYDPGKGAYVGTFVGSMMPSMWVYRGTLDASGRVLTLETEGPSMAEEGKTAPYRDIIEIVSEDHRTLSSETPGPDGRWVRFMTAHYRRVKR